MDKGKGVFKDQTAKEQVLECFDELLSGTSTRSKETILIQARRLIENNWRE